MLKAIFSMTFLVVVMAGQLPQALAGTVNTATLASLQQNIEQDVAPCENGFDGVNVCHLRS